MPDTQSEDEPVALLKPTQLTPQERYELERTWRQIRNVPPIVQATAEENSGQSSSADSAN